MENKCICLARVSTELQTLESQIEKLKDAAKNHGYKEKNILVVSGTESAVKLDIEERQTIQQMKELIESDSSINMIFIWEVSRLSRRPKVLYEVREWLIERKINLHCLTPTFTMLREDGSIDPTASIVFSIFGTMAEEEARLSKQRMLRGRIAKRDRGEYVGGNLLFGYDWDRKTFKIFIHEHNSKIVQEFFERYAAGESCRSITIDLFERHELPYNNCSTALVTTRKMLHRSEYAGIKTDTYDYPAIISKELWQKVRKVAESRNKYKTRLSQHYWLQKLIYWKDNDCLMSPAKFHWSYHHWDERLQKGIHINMNTADSLALQTVINYRKKTNKKEGKKRINELLEKIRQNHRKIQLATREIESIGKKEERINERYVNGRMSSVQADKLLDECILQEKEYRDNINRWNRECSIYGNQIEKIESGNDIIYEELTDKQVQELLREYIKKIYVSKGEGLRDKIVEIILIDDSVLTYYIDQKGNYPRKILLDGKPFDIKINKRFKIQSKK